MTLRTKLLLWYSGVFFFSAAFLVTTMYLLITHKMRQEFVRYFADEYEEAQRIVKEHIRDPRELERAVEVEVRGKKFFPLSYELSDVKTGKALLSIAPEWSKALPPLPSAWPQNDLTLTSKHNIGDARDDVIYMRTGWVSRKELPGILLRVGMSYKRVQSRLDKLGEYLLYALAVSVVLSLLGGRFLAARSLDPVDEVARSLERVEAHHLADRLDEPGVQDEVGRIVSAANRMLARLEDSFDRLSRFAGDAAHELRTPLSTLKCRLEVELQRDDLPEQSHEALADALQQADGLASLVDTLLLLAKLDAAPELEQPELVDLGLLVDDLREVFETWAVQGGLSLHIACAGGCTVQGDPALLRRLVANLLGNAVCYTPAGGQVVIEVSQENDAVCTTVCDTGLGIDEADLDKVFDRFYRAENSRNRDTGGTGLGLPICRRIVELHDGTIEMHSQKGAGTSVTVRLPRGQGPVP